MAATNPLVAQGTLNRVVGAVSWNDNPALNVTAPFLGREGIRLALDGESTLFIPTMTGAVTSEEPYMMITMAMHLLKTQALANLYKAKMETDSLVGSGTVRPDVPVAEGGIGAYDIINCAIEGVRELNFSGDDAGFVVTIRGYYLVNNDLWAAA